MLSGQVFAGFDQAPHEMPRCFGCVPECRVELWTGDCSLSVGVVAVGHLSDRQLHFHRGCAVAQWSICVLMSHMLPSAHMCIVPCVTCHVLILSERASRKYIEFNK